MAAEVAEQPKNQSRAGAVSVLIPISFDGTMAAETAARCRAVPTGGLGGLLITLFRSCTPSVAVIFLSMKLAAGLAASAWNQAVSKRRLSKGSRMARFALRWQRPGCLDRIAGAFWACDTGDSHLIFILRGVCCGAGWGLPSVATLIGIGELYGCKAGECKEESWAKIGLKANLLILFLNFKKEIIKK